MLLCLGIMGIAPILPLVQMGNSLGHGPFPALWACMQCPSSQAFGPMLGLPLMLNPTSYDPCRAVMEMSSLPGCDCLPGEAGSRVFGAVWNLRQGGRLFLGRCLSLSQGLCKAGQWKPGQFGRGAVHRGLQPIQEYLSSLALKKPFTTCVCVGPGYVGLCGLCVRCATSSLLASPCAGFSFGPRAELQKTREMLRELSRWFPQGFCCLGNHSPLVPQCPVALALLH